MAENDIENATTEGSIERAPDGNLADMEPEAIEALRLIEETLRVAESEAAIAQMGSDLEAPSDLGQEDHLDRIELLGRKALDGIRDIADFLNPIHKAGGKTLRPEPVVALLRATDLMYREIWNQRSRLAAIEKTMVQQAADLKTLRNDMSFLVNMLHSDEAET